MCYKMENLPSIINFHDDELHKTCFSGFEQMRRKGKLCDVTLISQNKRFAAHKIVLAATIPFFSGMFLSNMAETNKDEISILGLDACALEVFIGFAYTGSVQITPYNVQSLLIGASFLHISNIRNICCKYIEERLSPSTVLTVRDFAQSFMCGKLAAACETYILDHFDAVSQTDAFLRVDGAELFKWLDSDDLCVSSEEKVFQVVMDWIEYEPKMSDQQLCRDSLFDLGKQTADVIPSSLDFCTTPSEEQYYTSCSPPVDDGNLLPTLSFPSKQSGNNPQSRISLLPELLKRVRLPLISAGFISSVISKHKLIRENILCRDLLDEVRDMLLLHDRTVSSFSCRPRRGQETFGIIYAVGGLTANGDCHGIVETYHPSLGRWELAENMPSQRSRIGVVALNGRLYAIGGFDGTARLNTTEMYDPKTKTWQTLAPMNCKRSALGAAAMDGRIYVCGGYDGVSSLRACELYDPRHDKWFLIPSMNEPRSAGGLVALNSGCLYAVGGHNGLAIYSSVECYSRHATGPSFLRYTAGDDRLSGNVQTCSARPSLSGPWQPVARMIHRRCRHGVAVLRNRIIVAGGYNGVTFLRSVEVFDPAAGPDANGVMGQWTEIASLGVPRSRVGLAVTGGRLYAIGGYDGTMHLRTVECFQPGSDFSTDGSMFNSCPSTSASDAKPTSVLQTDSTPSQLNQDAQALAATQRMESAVSGCSDDEDDDTSSLSTGSASETTSQSRESQAISRLESRTVVQRVNPYHNPPASVASGPFTNWSWIPSAPLIAHEGWVGVGVLPIDEPNAVVNETLTRPTPGSSSISPTPVGNLYCFGQAIDTTDSQRRYERTS